jgi:hypothetical protein
VLNYNTERKSGGDFAEHCGYKDMRHFSSNFLKPLLESGRLQMTHPDKPSSRHQKYVAAVQTNHQQTDDFESIRNTALQLFVISRDTDLPY